MIVNLLPEIKKARHASYSLKKKEIDCAIVSCARTRGLTGGG